MSAALWGAPCDQCDIKVIVDGDGKDIPDPAEWEQFPECPVCGATLHFDGFDETQWNRETRLMNGAAKAALLAAARDADDMRMATWLRERAEGKR